MVSVVTGEVREEQNIYMDRGCDVMFKKPPVPDKKRQSIPIGCSTDSVIK